MESQRGKKFWWPARIRTLAFVALLGLHFVVGARAQERDDVSARTDPTIQAEAARFRYQRLQGVISLFIQAANSDGPLGENIRQTLRDRQAVLFNQNTPLPEGVRVVRQIVATLFKEEATRDLAVSILNQVLRRTSDTVKESLISQSQAGKPIRVSEIVVGMGPVGAAYVQEKTTSDPNRGVLVIDRGARPGGTFANVDDAFALNSTNRKNTGDRAQPGSGDLNYVHDIVGGPDFVGVRWGSAGYLAELASVGVALSSALPAVQTEIIDVRFIDGSPDKLVTLRDIQSGERFDVIAGKVIFATALGEPRPFGEEATDALIRKEKASAKRARGPAPIETFTDFINRIGDRENRTPLRDLVGKDVLVIGNGDSGRVVNEFLTNLAPEGAYRADVAQVGQPKRIFWFVGLDGFRRCSEYIEQSRARYSRLAQALNSGQLIPVPGRVTRILKSEENGKFEVDYRFRTEDGRTVNKTLIEYIQPADERAGRSEEAVQKERVGFDKVILTTGFVDQIPTLLKNVLKGEAYSDAWKFVSRQAEGFDRAEVNVAREINVGSGGIYLVGAANESLGGLPLASELDGVNANTVSLFANVERTKTFARATAEAPVVNSSSLETLVEKLSREKETLALSRGKETSVSVEVSQDSMREVRRVMTVELALRSALDVALRPFAVESRIKEIVLHIERTGEESYRVDFVDTTLDRASKRRIENVLRGNDVLGSVLMRDYLRSNGASLDITIPIRSSGKFDLEAMEIARPRGL